MGCACVHHFKKCQEENNCREAFCSTASAFWSSQSNRGPPWPPRTSTPPRSVRRFPNPQNSSCVCPRLQRCSGCCLCTIPLYFLKKQGPQLAGSRWERLPKRKACEARGTGLGALVHSLAVFAACERPSKGAEKETRRSSTRTPALERPPLLHRCTNEKIKTQSASRKHSSTRERNWIRQSPEEEALDNIPTEGLNEHLGKPMFNRRPEGTALMVDRPKAQEVLRGLPGPLWEGLSCWQHSLGFAHSVLLAVLYKQATLQPGRFFFWGYPLAHCLTSYTGACFLDVSSGNLYIF